MKADCAQNLMSSTVLIVTTSRVPKATNKVFSVSLLCELRRLAYLNKGHAFMSHSRWQRLGYDTILQLLTNPDQLRKQGRIGG